MMSFLFPSADKQARIDDVMNVAHSLMVLLAFTQALSAATSTNLPPPPAASPAELQRQFTDHLAAPRFHTAQWGIKLVSMDGGGVLFEHRADQLLSPASNTKLFTTALALDRFGPNYRIKTSILAPSQPDAAGRLSGDLIVFGRGDPTLNSRVRGGTIGRALDLFVNTIKSAGIQRIDGDLIGDESFFRGSPFGTGWAIDDLQSYFGAEISALTFNDNTLDVVVKPAKQAGVPALVSLSVSNSMMILSNRVSTVAKGGMTSIDLYRPFGENLLYVSGTIAMESSFKDEIPVHRPARLFVELLRQALAQQNITVTGRAQVVDWKDREVSPLNLAGLIELGAVESLPLSDIVREIQKPSQNLYTDLLLAHVGEMSRPKAGANQTSEEAGIVALNAFLPKAGIKKSDVLFEEGSGLSRNNLVTPNAIISLLTYMHRQPTGSVYFDALPVAGVDGTLRTRFKKTPAEGNLRAKTGSLRWASSLSGTVTNTSGEPLLFSIMVNRYNNLDPDHSARAEIDALALMMARSTFRTKPDANKATKPRADAANDALADKPN